MTGTNNKLIITPDYEFSDRFPVHRQYQKILETILNKIFHKHFSSLSHPIDSQEEVKRRFHSILPLFTYSELTEIPGTMSIYLISICRPNAFKFYFEMVSGWLIPGYRLNVPQFYAADFRLPQISDEVYTLCELMVSVESRDHYEEIQRNLPIIDTEIRLGVASSYYARRILEVKGLAPDQKTAQIQERIAHLVKRLPDHFDFDVFTEMQHVLVVCRDSFKNLRDSRHLSRIISINYIFRKNLYDAVKVSPEKRHLFLKILNAKLHYRSSHKPVLGILVGMNFLGDKEFFEDRHILKAIQNYIPEAEMVDGSFFSIRRGTENIVTHYLEVVKEDESPFTSEEIKLLRLELPNNLKDRIEQLIHPVFMPRNEEEIMRNILSLSNQIKYVKDIPQVFISFDEQTFKYLYFTVILVRIVSDRDWCVQELFEEGETFLEYIHDFTKKVGMLRKKYVKEATVFRVKLPKEMFLRDDHSIDLYKARQVVYVELERLIGSIRDFNGGMISKQSELLGKVRNLLADHGIVNDFLIENFFYSLTPASLRSVFDPNVLKTLFMMMQHAIDKGFHPGEEYSLTIRRDLEVVYVMIVAESPGFREELTQVLDLLNIPQTDLGTTCTQVQELTCLGYIYCCDDPYNQEHFCQTIKNTVDSWNHAQLLKPGLYEKTLIER